jgi:chemotaxis protein MotB
MTQEQELAIEESPQAEPVTAAEEPIPTYLPQNSPETAFKVNSFVIEDSFYRERTQRPVHWSVAWSDLMMTMFVLFLSMFVYQASHEAFLVSDTPEIIGGNTIDAIDIFSDSNIIVPIVPFSKDTPPINTNSVKKVKKIHVEDLDIDKLFNEQVVFVEPQPKADDTITDPADTLDTSQTQKASSSTEQVRADIEEPAPLDIEKESVPEFRRSDSLTDMYDMSRELLSKAKLDKFASIDIVPDKTMRIILTGDLLFFTGQADLSGKARNSLIKIAAVIKNTPYMVNVIGHTDNLPMHSSRFASNWELSLVRASSVARFLIEEMGMDSKQFIVSGFGSNRPRRPNTNVVNRAANRRVEIIISKRLAPAVKANAENLL